jgi:hypothetical protein
MSHSGRAHLPGWKTVTSRLRASPLTPGVAQMLFAPYDCFDIPAATSD